jgi:hypothetical protein
VILFRRIGLEFVSVWRVCKDFNGGLEVLCRNLHGKTMNYRGKPQSVGRDCTFQSLPLYHPAAPTCRDRSLDLGALTHSREVYVENLKKENGESAYSVRTYPYYGN